MDRRRFFRKSAFGVAGLALSRGGFTAEADLAPFRAEIEKRHGDTLKMLQRWIAQPTIAAENKGIDQGCGRTMQLFRDSGFDSVQRIPPDGVPGIFATLNAGAPRTVGLYFMYDVKQADPAEWSSPPWEGRLVDKPGFGKVLVGRGATNQKGPEAAFLAALQAFRSTGRKVPVNLVMVAEGEGAFCSPHFPQIVAIPSLAPALSQSPGTY